MLIHYGKNPVKTNYPTHVIHGFHTWLTFCPGGVNCPTVQCLRIGEMYPFLFKPSNKLFVIVHIFKQNLRQIGHLFDRHSFAVQSFIQNLIIHQVIRNV
jgi:hypothetical protein